jgi:hypothetical protein
MTWLVVGATSSVGRLIEEEAKQISEAPRFDGRVDRLDAPKRTR